MSGLAGLLTGLAIWLAMPKQPRISRTTRVSRRPISDPLGAALVMDLLAAALASGSTLPDALDVVSRSGAAAHADQLGAVALRLRDGLSEDGAWEGLSRDLEPLMRIVELVVAAGVPASLLLQSGARDLRRRCAREAEIRAARLGVRLVLPLGLCALPAFIAWSVVPVVLALARQLI